MSEDEADRLRRLQAEYEQAAGLYDRFGDERFSKEAARLKAEIAAISPEVRQDAETAAKLVAFTGAVEDYIVARAAQFFPDADDVWAAIMGVADERFPIPAGRTALQQVNELRALGISDADLQAAARQAERLENYKNPPAQRRAAGAKSRVTYEHMLRKDVAGLLAKEPNLNPFEALLHRIAYWQSDPTRRSPDPQINHYRISICSAIAVLRKLGAREDEITALLRDAFDQRR